MCVTDHVGDCSIFSICSVFSMSASFFSYLDAQVKCTDNYYFSDEKLTSFR